MVKPKRKSLISRSIEHQQESIKGNWSSSGATDTQRNATAISTGYTPKHSP